jgi:hypothetical protein
MAIDPMAPFLSGVELLAADRVWKPPTSSSLADEQRVGSLLLSLDPRM